MRLEYLCDMELAYREAPGLGAKLLLIRPFGGEEGTGYGEGDGAVDGPRLRGAAGVEAVAQKFCCVEFFHTTPGNTAASARSSNPSGTGFTSSIVRSIETP